MARKKGPPAPPPDDDSEFEEPQADDDLSVFLDELDTSVAMVEIFRCNRDGSRAQLDRVAFDSVRDDPYGFIRSGFGPGKYLLVFKDSGRKFRKSKVVDVGAVIAPNPAAAAAPPPVDHLSFMREHMAMQNTLITGLIAAIRPPDLSFLAGVLKPPDTAGMFTAIVTATQMLNPQQKPTNNNGESDFDRIGKILRLAQDLAPDSGTGEPAEEESPLWALLKEVAGKATEALIAGSAPGAAVVAPPAAPPVRVTPVTNGHQQTTTVESPPMNYSPAHIRQLILTAIAYLKKKAEQKSDPELYVEFICDNADEPMWNAVLLAIQQGAKHQDLLTLDPALAENPAFGEWFEKLYWGLHAEVFNLRHPGGPGGDPRNAAAHAEAGVSGDPAPGAANLGGPAREP